MIEDADGNILNADTEAVVNTVNTVGVMGKGLALNFKQAYPEMFKAYTLACDSGEVEIGRMHLFDRGAFLNPRYIINFPTKQHWKSRSSIDNIARGLDDLVRQVKSLGIRSIAIPPLGCGLGGLSWNDVRPLIADAFSNLPTIHVRLYKPQSVSSP